MEKYFGPIPRGPKPPAPTVQTQPITRQVRETLTDDVQLARVFVGVIAPPAWSDAGFAYDLAQEILAGGKTSRLYRALVFDRQLVQEVDMATDKATFVAPPNPGDGQARSPSGGGGGGARRRAGPARAHDALRMPSFAAPSATSRPALPGRRAAQRKRQPRRHPQRDADVARGPGFVNALVSRYRAVTAAQVQEAARRFLSSDARVVLIVNPGAARTASAQRRTNAMDRLGRLALLAPTFLLACATSGTPAPAGATTAAASRPDAGVSRRAPRMLLSGRRSPRPGRQ